LGIVADRDTPVAAGSGLAITTEDVGREQRLESLRRRESLHVEEAEHILRYGAFVGSVVECHAVLDRAMARARSHIMEMEQKGRSVHNGTVIFADSLGSSKGRFDRTWHAPAGGLWGCLIHANTLLPQSRNLIPLAVGVACCEAVRETGIEAELRWVNDVLVDGRKAAGFLIESFSSPVYREEYNLIGFGINVNNRRFPPELQDIALSLSQALGRSLDLNRFALLFLAKLAFAFGLLYREEEAHLHDEGGDNAGWHPMLQTWADLSGTVGRRVLFGFDVMKNPQYQATVTGISGSGGLILRLDDGHEKTEYCGEIRYL
jgi:BirA family biotin operon repressor/biotin-[acetyl-CoA-carboxylase] ligase